MEHVAQALESAADGGLAEKEALGGARDVSLFCENGEDDEEVEVGLAKLCSTHI